MSGEPEWAGLDMEMADVVLDAAEIVSRAAWSPPATRWLWLRWRVRKLSNQVTSIEDAATKHKIESARRLVR